MPAPAAVRPRNKAPRRAGQVINMITVEGREQVLLKVSVVEMERNILKQFGVDLERADQLGQFRLCRPERSTLPDQRAGQRLIAPFCPTMSRFPQRSRERPPS